MSILRKKKRARFTTIDNTSIEDERLRWDCKGLLLYLLSKPDGWTINRDHLASQTPDGSEKVRRILRDLESFGYIHRYQERQKNGTFIQILEILTDEIEGEK
jgi:hypothetical protein